MAIFSVSSSSVSFLCAGPPVADRSPRTACVRVLSAVGCVFVFDGGGGAVSDCVVADVDDGSEAEVVVVVVGAVGGGTACEREDGEGEDSAGGAYLD